MLRIDFFGKLYVRRLISVGCSGRLPKTLRFTYFLNVCDYYRNEYDPQ